MEVRELELDLDAFEGPFDLLLTLVLKEELDLAEVDVAGIVVAFCERLAERGELDLEACGEFLVLVAALLELKARGLFPDEEAELLELEPEEAAEELARRLAEYRRAKEAADTWPSWDPVRAAREFQPADASGNNEDIIDGNGSRPVGPKAASSASAVNPSRSPRSAPQCKITGRPVALSCIKTLTPCARMWRSAAAASLSAENTVGAASSTDMRFSPKNEISPLSAKAYRTSNDLCFDAPIA